MLNSNTIILIITAVVGVAIIGVLFFVLYRRQNPKQEKGVGRGAGSGRAVGALQGFARSNGYRFIAPAHIKGGEAVARLDAVAVGYFGVLGVVALGYNGEVYGAANDDEWLQVSGDGVRTHFPNPLLEASADVRILRDVLFGAGLKRVPVEVVAVFANPKAQLALPRSLSYYTLKTFKKLLAKEKYTEDKGIELDDVEKALKAAVVSESKA